MTTSLITSFDPTSGAARLEQPLAARPGTSIFLKDRQVGKITSRSTLLIQDAGAKQLTAQGITFRLNFDQSGQLQLSDSPSSNQTTKVLGAGGAFQLVKHQRRPSEFNLALAKVIISGAKRKLIKQVLAKAVRDTNPFIHEQWALENQQRLVSSGKPGSQFNQPKEQTVTSHQPKHYVPRQRSAN